MKKWIKYTALILITLTTIVFLAFKLSPWPSVLIVRYAFDKGGVEANQRLEKHVPKNIVSFRNISYDRKDSNVLLDIYEPKEQNPGKNEKYPIIVWIHGGGLVSGSKEQVANYCKILAGYGYAVAAIDYTIAPEARYPTPILQTHAALSYLMKNADQYRLDRHNVFLAGDSGGSMIAATATAVIFNPEYSKIIKVIPAIKADQLKGMILFCGIYDVGKLNLEGSFGSFMKTVLWSYFGKKDISGDKYAQTASVINYIDNTFPVAFISAGNADPLLPQSLELKKKMCAAGIAVDTLFFPKDKKPGMGHEYQFNLDSMEGQLALKRCLSFLKSAIK